VLPDAEICAVLALIKGAWPRQIPAAQVEVIRHYQGR